MEPSKPPVNHLERVRTICLGLPEAEEKIAWGAPTFRIRNKLFATFADNHHKDGRIALWCNAPEGLQEQLVAAQPDKFFRPPYMGPKGWIGLILTELSDDEIKPFVQQAYTMIAPKKLILALEAQSKKNAP